MTGAQQDAHGREPQPITATEHEDAPTRLAGLLAERAITELILTTPDGNERTLRARECDLPGELRRAPPGTTLHDPRSGVSVRIDKDGIRATGL